MGEQVGNFGKTGNTLRQNLPRAQRSLNIYYKRENCVFLLYLGKMQDNVQRISAIGKVAAAYHEEKLANNSLSKIFAHNNCPMMLFFLQ